jgi:hypothetical protein
LSNVGDELMRAGIEEALARSPEPCHHRELAATDRQSAMAEILTIGEQKAATFSPMPGNGTRREATAGLAIRQRFVVRSRQCRPAIRPASHGRVAHALVKSN